MRELDASIEMLLEGPELVLGEPGSSQTGLALQGLLTAQVASRVGAACSLIPELVVGDRYGRIPRMEGLWHLQIWSKLSHF